MKPLSQSTRVDESKDIRALMKIQRNERLEKVPHCLDIATLLRAFLRALPVPLIVDIYTYL